MFGSPYGYIYPGLCHIVKLVKEFQGDWHEVEGTKNEQVIFHTEKRC